MRAAGVGERKGDGDRVHTTRRKGGKIEVWAEKCWTERVNIVETREWGHMERRAGKWGSLSSELADQEYKTQRQRRGERAGMTKRWAKRRETEAQGLKHRDMER